MARTLKPSLFAFLLASATGVLFAQEPLPTPQSGGASAEKTAPQIISSIKYHFAGNQGVDREAVAAHVQLKEGKPFFLPDSDASIQALYRTGLYEFVSIEPALLPTGAVEVTVFLVPRPRVQAILFEGNKEWSATGFFANSGLQAEVLLKEGEPLDEVLVKRSVEKLRKKYHKKFPFVKITPRIERDEKAGMAVVTFVVEEGLNTTIDRIAFAGNEHIAEENLRDEMETTTWSFWKFSWLTNAGRFHPEEFREDLEKLRSFYRDQGFLDVEIPDQAAETTYLSDDGEDGELLIQIKIAEGRRYEVGELKVEGNTLGDDSRLGALFKTETILQWLARRTKEDLRPYPWGDRVYDWIFSQGVKALDPKEVRTNFDSLAPGDWYSTKAVTMAREKIRDYYGQFGYLNCYVEALRQPNLETGKIDILFRIREGRKYHLNSVNIYGNTRTRNRVILRELALTPGDVFSTTWMKSSEARLRNTQYFESVRLAPEPTNVPGVQNLRIDLKEGRTGSLSFGAGFSTVEEVVGYVEYSESNFDIFNYRNYFRGGGQKFRLRVQAGTASSSIVQHFEEPSLFDRDLAFGYEARLTNNNYDSDYYEERRLGTEFYFRRNAFERVYARLSYQIEEARIRDIDSTAPNFVKAEEGSKLISKMGLTFSRDTRNDWYFPTSGNRVSLAQYVAGGPFGGDVNYYSIEARAAQWIPIFDTGEQTLQLMARAGSMVGFGDKEIPFYEKFSLGGPYTLRGCKYKHIGPFEGDEPMGGQTYGFFSAEYTVKLIDKLRFAVFYDWGFVNADRFDFSTSDYNDNVGFGFRILIMGAVMRIDLGFPITSKPENDDGMRFNFSFGTVF